MYSANANTARGRTARTAVIFHVARKSIKEDEKSSCHSDVDVYWQSCALFDSEFSVKWAKNKSEQSVNDLNCFLLFLDNLPTQETYDFKNAVAGLNDVAWFGLKNATDSWQVVYAGLGQMLKVLVARDHQFWLDQEENADRWHGSKTEPFRAI